MRKSVRWSSRSAVRRRRLFRSTNTVWLAIVLLCLIAGACWWRYAPHVAPTRNRIKSLHTKVVEGHQRQERSKELFPGPKEKSTSSSSEVPLSEAVKDSSSSSGVPLSEAVKDSSSSSEVPLSDAVKDSSSSISSEVPLSEAVKDSSSSSEVPLSEAVKDSSSSISSEVPLSEAVKDSSSSSEVPLSEAVKDSSSSSEVPLSEAVKDSSSSSEVPLSEAVKDSSSSISSEVPLSEAVKDSSSSSEVPLSEAVKDSSSSSGVPLSEAVKDSSSSSGVPLSEAVKDSSSSSGVPLSEAVKDSSSSSGVPLSEAVKDSSSSSGVPLSEAVKDSSSSSSEVPLSEAVKDSSSSSSEVPLSEAVKDSSSSSSGVPLSEAVKDSSSSSSGVPLSETVKDSSSSSGVSLSEAVKDSSSSSSGVPLSETVKDSSSSSGVPLSEAVKDSSSSSGVPLSEAVKDSSSSSGVPLSEAVKDSSSSSGVPLSEAVKDSSSSSSGVPLSETVKDSSSSSGVPLSEAVKDSSSSSGVPLSEAVKDSSSSSGVPLSEAVMDSSSSSGVPLSEAVKDSSSSSSGVPLSESDEVQLDRRVVMPLEEVEVLGGEDYRLYWVCKEHIRNPTYEMCVEQHNSFEEFREAWTMEHNLLHAQQHPEDKLYKRDKPWRFEKNVASKRNTRVHPSSGSIIARVWALQEVIRALEAFMWSRYPPINVFATWVCDQTMVGTLHAELVRWEMKTGVLNGRVEQMTDEAERARAFINNVFFDDHTIDDILRDTYVDFIQQHTITVNDMEAETKRSIVKMKLPKSPTGVLLAPMRYSGDFTLKANQMDIFYKNRSLDGSEGSIDLSVPPAYGIPLGFHFNGSAKNLQGRIAKLLPWMVLLYAEGRVTDKQPKIHESVQPQLYAMLRLFANAPPSLVWEQERKDGEYVFVKREPRRMSALDICTAHTPHRAEVCPFLPLFIVSSLQSVEVQVTPPPPPAPPPTQAHTQRSSLTMEAANRLPVAAASGEDQRPQDPDTVVTKRTKFGIQPGEKRDGLSDFLEKGFAYMDDCLGRREPIDFCGQDKLHQNLLHYLAKVPEEKVMAAVSLINKMVRRFRDHARHADDVIQIGWLQKSKLGEDFISLAIHRRDLWEGVRGSIPLECRVTKLQERYGGAAEAARAAGFSRDTLHRLHRIRILEEEVGPDGNGCTPKQRDMLDEALRVALLPVEEKHKGLQTIYEGVRERLKEYARVAARPQLVAHTAPDLLAILHLLYATSKAEREQLTDGLVDQWYWRALRSGVATLTEAHLQFRNTTESEAQCKALVVQSLLLDRFKQAEQTDLIGFSITGSSIPERDYSGGVVLSGLQLGSIAGDFAYVSKKMLVEEVLKSQMDADAVEALLQKQLYFKLTPRGKPTTLEIYDSHLPNADPVACSPLAELDHHPRANPSHNNAFNTREGAKSTVLLLFASKYNSDEEKAKKKYKDRLPFPFYAIHSSPTGDLELRNGRHLRGHLQLDRTEHRSPELTPVEVFTQVGPAAEDLIHFVETSLFLVRPIQSKVALLEEPRPRSFSSGSDVGEPGGGNKTDDDDDDDAEAGGVGCRIVAALRHSPGSEATTITTAEETQEEANAQEANDDDDDDASDLDSDDDADRASTWAAKVISSPHATSNGDDPKVGTIRARLYGGRMVERRNVFLGKRPLTPEEAAAEAVEAAKAAAAEAASEAAEAAALEKKRKALRRPWTHDGDAEEGEKERLHLKAVQMKAKAAAEAEAKRQRDLEEGHPYYLTRTRNRIYVVDIMRIDFEYVFSAVPPASGHLRGIVGYIDLMHEKQRKLLYCGERPEEDLYYREDSVVTLDASCSKEASRCEKKVEVKRTDPRNGHNQRRRWERVSVRKARSEMLLQFTKTVGKVIFLFIYLFCLFTSTCRQNFHPLPEQERNGKKMVALEVKKLRKLENNRKKKSNEQGGVGECLSTIKTHHIHYHFILFYFNFLTGVKAAFLLIPPALSTKALSVQVVPQEVAVLHTIADKDRVNPTALIQLCFPVRAGTSTHPSWHSLSLRSVQGFEKNNNNININNNKGNSN
eukprot:gene7508-5293_t